FDCDGKLDFYVTRPGTGKADSWLSGKAGDRMKQNQLWRNRGHWQFENVTARSGTSGDNRSTFTAAWLDADNDGWPDLYVINEFGNGVLYRNRHDGTFEAHELFNGPIDFGSMGLIAGDIDNDGNIDLYLGNMYSKAGNRVIGNLKSGIYPDNITAKIRTYVTGSQLWRNRGGLKFEPQGQHFQVNSVGWSYGPALVDLDNDGYLDIYATCGFVSHARNEPDG
ncbi:MAG TPA: VCBS repeat-containing protein, partial [Gemmataceae bacterium]|nr:VCBS repeat-containing protein [Gemmataceae bacterium]